MIQQRMLLSALLLSFFAVALSAQKINVGLRTGFNSHNIHYSELIGSVAPDFANITQFNTGVFAEIALTDHFSVQPEMNLVWKGFGLKQGLDVDLFGVPLPLGVRAETKFRYIEVPLLAKYTFGDQAIKAYVTAGPTLGYATKGRIDTKANVIVEIPLTRTNIDLADIGYNRFELGAAVGAGFQADLGALRAFVDARYTHGFTSLYELPLINETVKNKGFGINLGVSVPIN